MEVRAVTVPATLDDAELLAETMREADAKECIASTGKPLLDTIMDGIGVSSEKWARYYNGRIAYIWGVVPRKATLLGPKRGIGWLLTSTTVDKYPVTFWRDCKHIFPQLLDRWDSLDNCMHLFHSQALRWGGRLGFEFGLPMAFGVSGEPFIPFMVTKESLNV